MAMSLVASTRRVALMPAYAKNLLPSPAPAIHTGGSGRCTRYCTMIVPVMPRLKCTEQ
jgi:hypothetical protein